MAGAGAVLGTGIQRIPRLFALVLENLWSHYGYPCSFLPVLSPEHCRIVALLELVLLVVESSIVRRRGGSSPISVAKVCLCNPFLGSIRSGSGTESRTGL